MGNGAGVGLGGQPAGDVCQSRCQQFDVEDVGAVAFFGGGQQVEHQGGEPGLVQDFCDVAIAGAVPAASAAVCEHDDARGVLGDGQVPGYRHGSGEHLDFLLAQRRVGGCVDRGILGNVALGAIEKRDHLVVGGLA